MDYTQYGYRQDLENKAKLISTSSRMPALTFAAPKEIDPRPWHKIENQGPMGSCQGHALASVVEYAYHIATGEVIQLSCMWCYIETQRIDGLIGSDRGSTIDGGRRLSEEKGVCELSVFPYPNPIRYSTQVPQGAAENASKYKIRSHVMCNSYQDVFQFLASGAGGVELGIMWNDSMYPKNGVVERYRGGGGGGHAIAFLGYSSRKDSNGRNYLWLANSHSDSYGVNGYVEVAPQAVDDMFGSQWTVMIGLSDLSVPKSRKFDWSKKSPFHPHPKS
jgi:hypothetical protein